MVIYIKPLKRDNKHWSNKNKNEIAPKQVEGENFKNSYKKNKIDESKRRKEKKKYQSVQILGKLKTTKWDRFPMFL